MIKPLVPFVDPPGSKQPRREDLLALVGLMDAKLVPTVSKYLKECPHFLTWMEYTRDVVDDRFGVSGGSAIVSDGSYYWRADAADYVAIYAIGLPIEFMTHGASQGWDVPIYDRNSWLRIFDELQGRPKEY